MQRQKLKIAALNNFLSLPAEVVLGQKFRNLSSFVCAMDVRLTLFNKTKVNETKCSLSFHGFRSAAVAPPMMFLWITGINICANETLSFSKIQCNWHLKKSSDHRTGIDQAGWSLLQTKISLLRKPKWPNLLVCPDLPRTKSLFLSVRWKSGSIFI